MLKALALCLAVILLVLSCSERHDSSSAPPIDLATIYKATDHEEIDRLVKHYQGRFRRILQGELGSLIKFKAIYDSSAVDSLYPQLAWLCDEYQRASGVAEKTRRLNLYHSWSSEKAAFKLQLDSSFAKAFRIYDTLKTDEITTRYISALQHIQTQYKVIADSFMIASIDHYRGEAFMNSGQYDSAMSCLKRGISICKKIDHFEQAGGSEMLLIKIQNVYIGDYTAAERNVSNAIRYYGAIGNAEMVARARIDRAFNLSKLHKTDRSIEKYKDVIADFEALDKPYWQGYCTYALGELFYDLGYYDSAFSYAQDAYEIRSDLQSNSNRVGYIRDVAYSLSTLGLILQAQGNYKEAATKYFEAEAKFQEADHIEGLSDNYLRLASLFLKTNDLLRAEELFQFVVDSSRRFEDGLAAIYGLAVCSFHQEDYDKAIELATISIARIERSRDYLPHPEMTTGLFSDKLGYYHLPAVAFIRKYLQTNNLPDLDSAFKYIEQSKARALLDMMRPSKTGRETTLEKRLKERISDQELALITGRDDPHKVKKIIRKLEDSLLTLRVMKPSESASTRRFNSSELSTIGDIRQLLAKNDILLEYIISEFGSFLIVLTNGSFTVHELDYDRHELNRIISKYVSIIGRYPQAVEVNQEWRKLSRQLYDALLPLGPDFADGKRKRLIIIASDKLHYLPFETLVGPNDKYLIEFSDVSYAPSGTTMNLLLENSSKQTLVNRLVGFGNPDFGQSGIDSLPYSALELDSLASIFGSDKSDIFMGTEASEENFRTSDFSASYLHIATHGFTNDSRPGYSSLLFAGGADKLGVASLSSYEIAGMNIPADLVFLSACQSGSGRSYPGEGVLSLSQPFLAAGAGSVIVTYWNINDRFSVNFVSTFYRQLLSGQSKTHALALAKVNSLKNPVKLYRHPYFWAPFVLNGLPD